MAHSLAKRVRVRLGIACGVVALRKARGHAWGITALTADGMPIRLEPSRLSVVPAMEMFDGGMRPIRSKLIQRGINMKVDSVVSVAAFSKPAGSGRAEISVDED
jgi:hypothetical protein